MKKYMKKLLISFGVFSLLFVGGCKNNEEETPKEPVQVRANSIYAAPKNPTDEIATVYNQLTDAIESGADDQTMAGLVATNFAYDFFTFSNKESATDIGGLEYIPNSMREEFSKFASDWFYQNYDIIVNLYGAESLPYVTMHEITSTTPEEVIFNENTYSGYRVIMTMKYKNSDIDAALLKTNMEIVLINVDGIFIVEEVK